jgi:small ligand-binding sensory domain FIST
VEAALAQVRAGLGGAPATLAVVFLGGGYAYCVDQVRDAVTTELDPEVLIGVTAQGVIAGAAEIENDASVSVWAAVLPGTVCTPLRYPAPAGGIEPPAVWPDVPADAHGLVMLADPFSFPADGFLAWVNQARPGLSVSGGMASGSTQGGGNRLLLDRGIYVDGAVAVALGGSARLVPLVSQGCRPVGPSYVVTSADRNLIVELGGKPAVERVHQVYAEAGDADRRRMRGGLHIGLVIDEYADDHETGDFLVRGVLGADPARGVVAVTDLVNVGQTVRLHVRDADSADEDLRRVIAPLTPESAPDAALLFTCNGRGRQLFGQPDHDAALVHEALNGAPLAGFFAAGEFGPVGGRSHLHGFTASLLAISTTDDAGAS